VLQIRKICGFDEDFRSLFFFAWQPAHKQEIKMSQKALETMRNFFLKKWMQKQKRVFSMFITRANNKGENDNLNLFFKIFKCSQCVMSKSKNFKMNHYGCKCGYIFKICGYYVKVQMDSESFSSLFHKRLFLRRVSKMDDSYIFS
jgi:hypothetical protein